MVRERFQFRACAFALILITAWSYGAPAQEEQLAATRPFRAVRTQLDRLYSRYLNGDREEAKRSMQEAVAVIQSAKLGPKFDRWEAGCLFFAYARLYVLEKRAGNVELAEADVVKARYWYLRKDELNGKSAEEASAAVAEFTPDRCMVFVDKWDRSLTNGLGPKYAREGRASAPHSHGSAGTTLPSTRPATKDPGAAQEREVIRNERSTAEGPGNDYGWQSLVEPWVGRPEVLSSADQLKGDVGRVVTVRGVAEDHKDSAMVACGFYGCSIPELRRWPHGAAGKRVLVTGLLAKSPGYTVPVESDVIPQAVAPPGSYIGPSYLLRNIEWSMESGAHDAIQ